MGQTIDTDVGKLAVFEQGSGAPTLLWHSLFLDHRSLLAMARELPDRRWIFIDGPGHGQSPGPGRPFDMAACARAAMQVLDALGVDAVDWVGNAWGGHVGVRAAVDFPKRVRSLVAIGTPLEPLGTGTRLQMRLLLVVMRLSLDRAGAILGGAMCSPSASKEVRDQVRQEVREAPKAGLLEAVRCISIHRKDLNEELSRVTCPTLFVAGADDKMHSPAAAAAQAARVPGGRSESLPGAAHLGPLERPKETAALVRAHWSR